MTTNKPLTIAEAADILGVSYGIVYAAIQTGQLRAYRYTKRRKSGKPTGTYRIDPADLEAYKASCATEPAKPAAPKKNAAGPSAFKNLDGDRLLEAWRQQGVLADPPDGRSAPSSASSNGPSAPPAS